MGAANGGKEGINLFRQRIGGRVGGIAEGDLRRRRICRRLEREDADTPLDEIDSGQGFALENAHLAFGAGVDAADRQIGNAAVGELDAGIGDVVGGRDHGGSHGVDPFDGRTDETQHEIEIVDHQIENRADRFAPRLEGAQALGLDEEGALDQLAHAHADAREAFDMADLENAAAAGGKIDQRFCILDGLGNGLFDQDMGAVIEEVAGDRVVACGRCCDADGIDLAEELAVVGQRLDVVARGDRLGTLGVPVDRGDKLDVLCLRQLVGVVLPEMADPDNGGSDRSAHRLVFHVP